MLLRTYTQFFYLILYQFSISPGFYVDNELLTCSSFIRLVVLKQFFYLLCVRSAYYVPFVEFNFYVYIKYTCIVMSKFTFYFTKTTSILNKKEQSIL